MWAGPRVITFCAELTAGPGTAQGVLRRRPAKQRPCTVALGTGSHYSALIGAQLLQGPLVVWACKLAGVALVFCPLEPLDR